MKKLFTIMTAVLLTASVFAQSPQKMSYQAVIRNSLDQLVTNHAVGMRISILQGSSSGTVVYTETQTPTTNANGVVSIEIGGGAGFDAINWANYTFFIKTETDPLGGTTYTITGTSQLLSVPYALNAKTAGTADYNTLSNLPTLNITNWNMAFGWGNHAGLYRPISYVPAWTDVTGKPTFATVATSGSYNDLSNKPTILNSQWTTSGSNIYYNSGNVGIGTSTPSSKLEVRGVTKSITLNGATATSGQFQAWTEGGAAGQRAVYSFYPTFEATSGDNVPRRAADIVGGFNAGNWGFEYLSFNVGSNGSANDAQNLTNEKMRITSTGNVGIGTISPTSKLDVNGVINVNNNKITNVATPTSGTDAANKAYVDNPNKIHTVGEIYGGGIVFYVTPNGQHGLIAEVMDQGTSVTWYNAQDVVSNPANHGSSTAVNYTDWRLPTKYELNLLYLQKSVVGGFAIGAYWSSTEDDNTNAWIQSLGNGGQNYTLKYYPHYVRAVRAF